MQGQVFLTTDGGLAGLWKYFPLWEVALQLNEISFVKVLSDHAFHSRRAVRDFFSSSTRALSVATKRFNDAFERPTAMFGRDCMSAMTAAYLQVFFATVKFDAEDVQSFLEGSSQEREQVSHMKGPVMKIPGLHAEVSLDMLVFGGDAHDTHSYYLEVMGTDVESDYDGGTRMLFLFSAQGDDFSAEQSYPSVGETTGTNAGVRRGSLVDKAVREGRPLPVILAVRNAPRIVKGRRSAAGPDDASIVLSLYLRALGPGLLRQAVQRKTICGRISSAQAVQSKIISGRISSARARHNSSSARSHIQARSERTPSKSSHHIRRCAQPCWRDPVG